MSKYIKLDSQTLRRLRRERGLSQEAASWESQRQSLRLSEATFKRAESGKSILHRTALDFAQFFDCPLTDLMERTGSTDDQCVRHDSMDSTAKVLLGRDFELQQFKEILNACQTHKSGCLLCLRGVAGIGKSRLLSEFKRIASASDFDFYGIQIKQTQGSANATTTVDLICQLLGVSEQTLDDVQFSDLIDRFDLSETQQLHLSQMLGLSTSDPDLQQLDESLSFTKRVSDEHQLLFQLIAKRHGQQPCVIAFDDMHWVDETLLLNLRHLSSLIVNVPVLLILATRLENDPIDALWRSCVVNTPTTTMDLSPFSAIDANLFAQRYPQVEQDYISQAIHLSAGNPLYLEQLLANYPAMVGCFPDDLRNLMQVRLETLPEQARLVIKTASVLGSKVELSALDFMLNDLDYDLNYLIQQVFIRPVDSENIEFCHELIRQGIYESLPQAEKQTLHETAANWYLGRDKRLYARHLSLSKSYKAPSAYLQAAEEQSEKHNYGAALSMVDQALAIESSAAERFQLLLTKGLILKKLELPEKSLSCFSDALEYAQDRQQRCEAYLEMTAIYHLLQRKDDALRCLNAASEHQTPEHQARLSYLQHQIQSQFAEQSFTNIGIINSDADRLSAQRIAEIIQYQSDDDPGISDNTQQTTDQTTIKVGLLHSQSGSLLGLEAGVIRTTLMAIGEINQHGGLLGKLIEPVLIDGQSSQQGFYQGAQQLLANTQINTIFGCSTSSSRRVVKPLIEANDHLLIYPFQYEGIEQSEHIFYVGPAPNQTALPAIEWLFHQQRRSFILFGSDYVYPVVTNSIIKQQLTNWQLELIQESYVPLGCTRFDAIIEQIKSQQPEAVVLTLVGSDSNREFFKQYHQAGLHQTNTTVLSLVLSENDLTDIPTESVTDTYTVFSYFQNFENPINEQFVRRYKQCFGTEKQVGGYMESAYVGVLLWAKAVQQANSLDRSRIKEAMRGIAHFGPGGIAYVDETNNHVWRHVQIAKVGKDGEFQPIWRSDKPVKPEPFPAGYSTREWLKQLSTMREQRWQGHWEKPCSGDCHDSNNKCLSPDSSQAVPVDI